MNQYTQNWLQQIQAVCDLRTDNLSVDWKKLGLHRIVDLYGPHAVASIVLKYMVDVDESDTVRTDHEELVKIAESLASLATHVYEDRISTARRYKGWAAGELYTNLSQNGGGIGWEFEALDYLFDALLARADVTGTIATLVPPEPEPSILEESEPAVETDLPVTVSYGEPFRLRQLGNDETNATIFVMDPAKFEDVVPHQS
jgi:hypothetical protein